MTSTKSVEAISPLRRRMIEDMCVRKFSEKTQHDYIRHVETFAKFLGRSPDTATGEDLRRGAPPRPSLRQAVPLCFVSICGAGAPDRRLCMCTMNAMPNKGVARLTIGIDTKAAMNMPATKTVPACRLRSALASATGR